MSRRSSLIGESTFGLATSMAKTSPDSARDIRMVRSFSASEMASAQGMNSCSTSRLELVIVGEHLQPRAGADAVVGQGRDDPPGVAVVGDLVAGAAAENGADAGVVGRIGGEQIGAGPVPAVLLGGHRGIVSPANVQGHADRAERAPRLLRPKMFFTSPSINPFPEAPVSSGRSVAPCAAWPSFLRGSGRPRHGRSVCAAACRPNPHGPQTAPGRCRELLVRRRRAPLFLQWRVRGSHPASETYEASLSTGPPAANQTGEPNKKGHARMRPRMAFCIGIAGRDQSVGVAESGFQFSVYPERRCRKERISSLDEIVTHLDMAAPACISLHSVLWHAGPISPCLRRRGDSTVPASKRAGPRKTGSLASCPDLEIVATGVGSPCLSSKPGLGPLTVGALFTNAPSPVRYRRGT